MDDLIAEFLIETNENLAALDDAILRLEREPGDAEIIARIFRLMHTIKGTGGFLGLSRLETVAHAAENVLGQLRDGVQTATPGTITTVLAAIDRVRLILAGIEAAGSEPAGDDGDLLAALAATARGEPPAGPDEEAAAREAVTEQAKAAPEVVEAVLEASEPPADTTPASGKAAPAPAVAPTSGDAPPRSAIAGQTIRVGVEVIETLMTLTGELVLARNQLLQLARGQPESPIAFALQRLSQITSDLQDGVMKARMQPVGQAWNKLPRLVRDLSRDLGKRVELVMQGAETELDRQVLELIRDPLTHMVRNSIDHGLESPADRRARGKPEAGQLLLSATHEAGHVVITISDDGRGLNLERIRARAIANGLCSEAEAARMDEAALQAMIFNPGFSTAEQVTAVSGRGVGLDVVRTNIERVGGTMEVRSVEGAGSSFIIRIPITLAIAAALIVEAGGERFALPQAAVEELVRTPGAGRIERVGETELLRLREQLLPLVRLAPLLGLPDAGEAATVIVLRAGTERFAVLVDNVADTEEIVVKPLAPILRHLTIFGGNTILGDGAVTMILDPVGIGRAAGFRADRQHGAEVTTTHVDRATALLLFRVGDGAPRAVPLVMVSRIEDIARSAIEYAGGREVMQYRGGLLPLVRLGPDSGQERHPVLVFADGTRQVGLVVDAIIDIVEAKPRVAANAQDSGLLGTAIIEAQATEIVDIAHIFALAADATPTAGTARRILVLPATAFQGQLITSWLEAAGHGVRCVPSTEEAIRLRDSGFRPDGLVIGADEESRALLLQGPWQELPAVAAPPDPAAMHRAALLGAIVGGDVA